jgi:hypothetical protein
LEKYTINDKVIHFVVFLQIPALMLSLILLSHDTIHTRN